jgi:hypothetical protein
MMLPLSPVVVVEAICVHRSLQLLPSSGRKDLLQGELRQYPRRRWHHLLGPRLLRMLMMLKMLALVTMTSMQMQQSRSTRLLYIGHRSSLCTYIHIHVYRACVICDFTFKEEDDRQQELQLAARAYPPWAFGKGKGKGGAGGAQVDRWGGRYTVAGYTAPDGSNFEQLTQHVLILSSSCEDDSMNPVHDIHIISRPFHFYVYISCESQGFCSRVG